MHLPRIECLVLFFSLQEWKQHLNPLNSNVFLEINLTETLSEICLGKNNLQGNRSYRPYDLHYQYFPCNNSTHCYHQQHYFNHEYHQVHKKSFLNCLYQTMIKRKKYKTQLSFSVVSDIFKQTHFLWFHVTYYICH